MFIVERATLLSFSAGTYTATLQMAGSLSAAVAAVPVSRGIASGELLAGRRVTVAIFDEGNPVDAMVIGVH